MNRKIVSIILGLSCIPLLATDNKPSSVDGKKELQWYVSQYYSAIEGWNNPRAEIIKAKDRTRIENLARKGFSLEESEIAEAFKQRRIRQLTLSKEFNEALEKEWKVRAKWDLGLLNIEKYLQKIGALESINKILESEEKEIRNILTPPVQIPIAPPAPVPSQSEQEKSS